MADGKKSNNEVFDIDRLRHLVELMQEHDLSEIDLRNDAKRIKLRRGSEPVFAAPVAAAPAAASHAAPVAAGGAPAAPAVEEGEFISSPMVGTFYTSPKPGAPPFVKVGDHVTAETTVCVVEAMKMFNEIPAGTSGTIAAVVAKNEDPVDVGKNLFKIVPD